MHLVACGHLWVVRERSEVVFNKMFIYPRLMNLAIDYYGTIEKNPRHYRRLAEAVRGGGGAVFIISAVEAPNVGRAERDIKKARVPNDGVHVITYDKYLAVPKLKLAKCKELEVSVLIDNRADTVAVVSRHRIVGLKA